MKNGQSTPEDKKLELQIWQRERRFIQQQIDNTKNSKLKFQLVHQMDFVKEQINGLKK